MRKNLPAKAQELLELQRRADSLLEAENFEEAIDLLREVRDSARKEGWGTATPAYLLSFVYFRQDRLEDAFHLLLESLSQDPLNPQFHAAHQTLMQRMREVIEAKDLPPDDPRIPRYHAILAREGEATVETHLAMVRHLTATEKLDEARKLADALTVLHPEHPEVWRLHIALGGRERVESEAPELPAFVLSPPRVAKA